MKTGDTIEARPIGAGSWVECRVEIASENGKSLCLSADEGLPLVGIDPATCRQMLFLSKIGDEYECIHTGRRFELRETGDGAFGIFVTGACDVIAIPVESDGHTKDALIVVLGPDNLERMKKADPAEFALATSGYNLVNPIILLCYEEQTPELMTLLQSGDLEKIVKHLRRGFEFRPDKGDHDRGPEKMADLQ